MTTEPRIPEGASFTGDPIHLEYSLDGYLTELARELIDDGEHLGIAGKLLNVAAALKYNQITFKTSYGLEEVINLMTRQMKESKFPDEYLPLVKQYLMDYHNG